LHSRLLGEAFTLAQTIEEATLFQVECNDTDVVVWTAAANVRLSQLAVSNKSLTVHGFEVSWKAFITLTM